LLAGVLLLIASTQWRAVDWTAARIRLSPASWLTGEVARGGPGGSAAAVELDRRVQAGAYAGEQLAAVARALWPLGVQVRPEVRAAEDLPVDVIQGPPITIRYRASDVRTFDQPYRIYYRLDRYRVGEGDWIRPDYFWERKELLGVGQYRHFPDLPAGTPSGPTTIALVFAIRVVHKSEEPMAQDRTGVPYRRMYASGDPSLVAWEQQVEAPIMVLQPGAEGVQLVVDPAKRGAMRASVRARREIVIRAAQDRSTASASWEVEVTSPPVAIACDVVLRGPGGAEIALGTVTARAGRTVRFHTSSAATPDLVGFTHPTATLVFRPSLAVARTTSDLMRIWGEDIAVPDVPVVRR
jgi:hypothetical protein